MQKRWITDGLMGLIFLLLLSFPFLPPVCHEWLGLAVIVAVAAHLRLNKNWISSLARGRWNLGRVVTSLLNALLFASLLATVVSGIIISNHLFRSFIPMVLRRNMMIHQLHLWAPWVLLILIGLHLGLNGKPMWMRLMRVLSINTRSTAYHIGSTALEMVVLFCGAFASVENSMGDRLLGEHIFSTGALDAGGPWYVAALLAIVGLYAVVGDKLGKLVQGKRQR